MKATRPSSVPMVVFPFARAGASIVEATIMAESRWRCLLVPWVRMREAEERVVVRHGTCDLVRVDQLRVGERPREGVLGDQGPQGPLPRARFERQPGAAREGVVEVGSQGRRDQARL